MPRYTEENGFGIYDPRVIAAVHEPVKEAEEKAEPKEKTGLFGRLFGKSQTKTRSASEKNGYVYRTGNPAIDPHAEGI